MKRSISSRSFDKEISVKVASALLENLNGLPIEDSLSYLNGITIALASFVKEIKRNVELSDDEGLEKLILSWLSATDPFTRLKFSKFISTECIDIDLSEL
jgi:hypothetical protein